MTTAASTSPHGLAGIDSAVEKAVWDELAVHVDMHAPHVKGGRSLVIAGIGTVARSMIAGIPFAHLMTEAGVEFTGGKNSETPADLLADATWDMGLSFSPWKEQLFDLLDHTSVSANATHAVDTVARTGTGVVGMNLNGSAATYALRTATRGARPARMVILGSGPSSRSVAWGARQAWGDDLDLVVSARSATAGKSCAKMFKATFVAPDDLDYAGSSIVVNSTSWGETTESENAPFAFDLARMVGPGDVVLDLNTRVSSLVSVALGRGAAVASGATMRTFNNACRAAIARTLASEGAEGS
jgi:shikimate dehydrogenase